MDTKTFIERANSIHGSRYDYSHVCYFNIRTKVEIVCFVHGSFFQSPDTHLNAGYGCRQCGFDKKRLGKEKFIEVANLIHKSKYDYSKVFYTMERIKVEVVCKKHGSFFVTPHNHIHGKFCGCPSCGYNISKGEIQWLQSLNNPNIETQQQIKINNKTYRVDGFDKTTNTIYEYFGDFYHGNLKVFNSFKVNPITKKTFQELNDETIKRIDTIRNAGYNLVYIWESEFKSTIPD